MSLRRGLLGAVVAAAVLGCGPSPPEPVVVEVEGGSDLQAVIDAAPDGAELRLAPGRYAGPIVITRPVSLHGEAGATIVGVEEEHVVSIVHSAGVTVRGLRIEGGVDGIYVRFSTGVVIDGVEVTGSSMHGIFANDAEVTITDCTVSGLRGPVPQGIEVTNSDGRPPSSVTRCRVEGPVFEGIVSHVSRVTIADSVVTGSTHRGISITEMSAGEAFGNLVSDASGTAYYCGDRAWCHFAGNSAERIVANDVGARSMQGHALVVQFHAEAYVVGLTTRDVSGSVALVMLGSVLNPDTPLHRPLD